MVLVLCVCEGERTDDKCEVQMLCGSGRGTQKERRRSRSGRGAREGSYWDTLLQ